MTHMLLILCLISYITHGAFERYEGGNCAYVYDSSEASIFPLDTCFLNYYPTDTANPYHAREYRAITEGEETRIERNTYYSQDCSGDVNEHINDVLDDDNLVLYNHPTNATAEDCYLEYIEYDVGSNTDSDCSGWNISSFQTKYIIVGACITAVNNQYSICNNSNIRYVRFNDDTCCDLSYSYTGSDGPAWRSYDNIKPGCNQDIGIYIDPESWICQIPDDANNANVYSDNTDPECKDNAFTIIISSYFSIFISMFVVFLI